MYKATMNDIWIKERSEVTLWAKIDKLDEHAREQFMLLEKLNSCHPRTFAPNYLCPIPAPVSNIGNRIYP
jgi:hypothetical protein